MPELPEVEIFKRYLSQLEGLVLEQVEILNDKIIKSALGLDTLIGRQLLKVNRYAKYLILNFGDLVLVSHLRMEGKYFVYEPHTYVNKSKHDHIIFTFTNGFKLVYNDTRVFGTMEIYENDKYLQLSRLETLAAEPFTIDLGTFYNKVKKSTKYIKTLLLDQHIIAGVGNIYADEILFATNLSPLCKGNNITYDIASKLIKNAIKILNASINVGGTTIATYAVDNHSGSYQNYLQVHTKAGTSCPKCNDLIKKIQVNGRGTYYCPTCQRIPKTIIGVSGSIATGKSSFCSFLKADKYHLIECDKIVSDLYKNKAPQLFQLLDMYGLVNKGTVTKSDVRRLIFTDKKVKKELEDIIHAKVFEKIRVEIRNCQENIIFVEMPLLFEVDFQKKCQEVIVIYTSDEIQRARLKQRDQLDDSDATLIIENQSMQLTKTQKATILVENNLDLLDLKKKYLNVIKEINKKYGV